MTAEQWRVVPGWAGYLVSDRGRVRSVERVLSDGRVAGGTELAQHPDKDGYLFVTLVQADLRWRVGVHMLICLAFRGARRGREVRHLNDQPDDNRLANLRWGTRQQNRQDQRRNRARRSNRTIGQEKYGTGETGGNRKPVSSFEDCFRPVSGGGER